MAGPPVASASRPRDPDGAAPNVVARVSQWADDHLRLVRNISTVMAIAGTMLLLRSIRMTSKFTSSSDIPVEFIRKNVKLRGRLRRITEDGLEIEHIPITLPIISSWKKEPCGVLLVKLAGVELTETGKLWLQEELKPSQLLWFQLLGKENSALFCYLLVNKVGPKEGYCSVLRGYPVNSSWDLPSRSVWNMQVLTKYVQRERERERTSPPSPLSPLVVLSDLLVHRLK